MTGDSQEPGITFSDAGHSSEMISQEHFEGFSSNFAQMHRVLVPKRVMNWPTSVVLASLELATFKDLTAGAINTTRSKT